MRDPTSDGIDPLKLLYLIDKNSRSLINPISVGIVPVPTLKEILNEVSEQNMPRSVGIGPILFRTNMNYYDNINITQTKHTSNTSKLEFFHY